MHCGPCFKSGNNVALSKNRPFNRTRFTLRLLGGYGTGSVRATISAYNFCLDSAMGRTLGCASLIVLSIGRASRGDFGRVAGRSFSRAVTFLSCVGGARGPLHVERIVLPSCASHRRRVCGLLELVSNTGVRDVRLLPCRALNAAG